MQPLERATLSEAAWLRALPVCAAQVPILCWLQIMDLIELTSIKDSLVGKPGISGLSVEQRKRLTIAVELVANPSIVFMDVSQPPHLRSLLYLYCAAAVGCSQGSFAHEQEPTSGLDARAAAIVIRYLRMPRIRFLRLTTFGQPFSSGAISFGVRETSMLAGLSAT